MCKDYGEQKESHTGNIVSVKNYLCPCLITSSDARWKKKHHNFKTHYPHWLAVLHSRKCSLRDTYIIYFYNFTAIVCYLWCCLKHGILQIIVENHSSGDEVSL